MSAKKEADAGGAGRIRVGLTGLAVVFLLVLLAAAFFGLAGRDRSHGDPMAGALTADRTPKEPLAELGVTPGNDPGTPDLNGAAPEHRKHRH